MRKKIAMCLAVVTALVLLATAVFAAGNDAAADKWDGSSKDTSWYTGHEEQSEFTITTAKELAGLAELVNGGNGFHGKTINLGADIDLDNQQWTPIGKVNGSFRGTFDGKEHTISNLTITGDLGLGLFGDLGANSSDHEPTVGTLQNLTINNAKITGRGYIGAFVGGGIPTYRQNGCIIKNCKLTGNVHISASMGQVGGIAGYISGMNNEDGANIENCTVSANPGSVIDGNGNIRVGGILGYTGISPSSIIKGCKVSGVTISGSTGVGGIVGVINQKNIIQDCSVENITVNSTKDDNTAGLIVGQINTEGSSAATLPKMYDCTADETSKVTAADAELEDPPLIGQNGRPVLVGTGIELDDEGKIKKGEIELQGNFSGTVDESELVATGSENDVKVKNGGFEEGKLVSYAVMVDDKGYETLEAALAAEETAENATVTLLKSISLSEAVNITKSVTIKGAEGITVTRAANYTGTFFTVSDGKTLTLSGVTIDAGGKWSIDKEKWEADKKISLEQNLSVYNGSWINNAVDPVVLGDGNVVTTANLIVLDGTAGLVLEGGTVIQNMYADSELHIIGWGNTPNNGTPNKITVNDAAIKQNLGKGSLVAALGRKADIALNSGAELTDNFNLSGANGGLFYLGSGASLTMESGASVIGNRGVNCNGTFFMSYGEGTVATMNGGTVSKNEGLKGGNTYCQPIYTHSGGKFVMNDGSITYNTGCNAGAIAQNPKGNTTVELNGGVIANNHYHGEGELLGYGEVFLSGTATVGKDVQITGEVGIYGQASVTVAEGNVIDGSVFVWSERYNDSIKDYKADLNGTITGDLYFQDTANVTVTDTGTVKGNVTVAEYDPGNDKHCEGPSVNKGTIEGTVTLEPGTSIQLGEEEVTAGENGAEFTVDGNNVTLLEGTLKAANEERTLTVKDSEGNELKPGEGDVYMIVVAEVTCDGKSTKFDNLVAAVAEAKNIADHQEAGKTEPVTVTLLKDAEGGGIQLTTATDQQTNKSPEIVIDFDHHTYTLTNPPVGSTGTATQGMQLKKGNTVTLKNGTLAVSEKNGTFEKNFLWLINNYANLTIENMTLDGTNLVMPGSPKMIFTLSNTGTADIKNTRFIDSNSQADGEIFSIAAGYGTQHAGYGTPAKVTIDDETTFNNVYVERTVENEKQSFDEFTDGMMAYVVFGGVKYGIDTTEPTAKSYIEFTKTGDTLSPVLPDANLNYSAIVDISIVDDCAAQTMWVRFDEPLPANTWLWFEITASDGTVYGIAAQGNGTATKFAWSFLNQKQFENWPKGKESIANGEATVKCYVLPGKVEGGTAPSADSMYFAWEKTVNVSNVTAYVPDPVVSVDPSLEDNKETLTPAANNTKLDPADMNDLAAEALTDPDHAIPTTEEAKEDLKNGGVEVGEDAVQIVVQTYMDVKVTDYENDENGKKLTFEIKPMYQVVATTAEDVKEIKLDGDEPNAVTIGEAHELTVTEPVTMTLGVPDNFLGEGAVYVKHVKDNGRTYYYRASSNKDSNTITFTNPHGFSEFTVIVTAPEFKAEIGDTLYETLKDAVDHVQNGETIVVTGDCSEENVTVGRSVSFSVKVNDGAQAGTITAGGGYNMSTSVSGTTTTYTVSYSAPPASGSSGYTVKTEEVENATVETSASSAKAGDEITVTVTTEANYHASLTVTAANGTAVEVKDNKDGTFTFVMPASNVTVTAEVYECPSLAFPDLDVTEWYHEYVDYAIRNDLMQGDGTSFLPEKTVSRAEMAGILWTLKGKPVVNYLMTFPDVPENEWYSEAIRWAASEGIIKGYDNGNFGPNDTINREQMAAMLYFYEQKLGTGGFADGETYELTFDDAADIAPWAQEAVAWCNMKGVITGSENKFNPADPSNRAQLATILALYDQLA